VQKYSTQRRKASARTLSQSVLLQSNGIRQTFVLLFDFNEPGVCRNWFVEAVGDVVVGRYLESPQGDQGVWFDSHPVLRDLLGT
jgi:hypothetical protein